LTTDGWKSFLDNLTRFYQLPGMEWDKAKLQIANQGNMFLKDRTVAMWLPVSATYTEKELAGMNWDLTTFPTDAKNPGVNPQVYPLYMFVSQTSKFKEPAYEVIAYLASEEFQLEKSKNGQFVSLLKSKDIRQIYGQDSTLYKGKNAKALLAEKNAPPMQVSKYNASAGGQLFNAFISVVTGVQDTNTALRTAEETVNKTIEADSKK
jgi:multiple sugar transport system substrate-binding protein